LRESSPRREGRVEAAAEDELSLALLLGVAGELARRCTAEESGGGATLGRGGGLRAREIGHSGKVRWPAAADEGQRRRRRRAYAMRVTGGGEKGGVRARPRWPGKIRV
jgi:hypothetical protein